MFTLILSVKDSDNIYTTNIINLRYLKERYTPYTSLYGRAIITGKVSDITEIALMDGSTLLHFGPPDTIEWEIKEGRSVATFSSKGFSAALGQNQLTPGIYSNKTLAELLRSNITLPHVEYEELSSPINYVYIKDNDSMWDSAAAFARKYSGEYPYISGSNTVRISRDTSKADLTVPEQDIVSVSLGQNCSHIISHLHMKNVEGNYNTYNLVNADAVDRGLIRHKHIAFDRQWLSDPNEAMQSRIDFAQRATGFCKVKYNGWNKEDIRQIVSFSANGISAQQREISRIELSVSQAGTFTTLWCYHDNYT